MTAALLREWTVQKSLIVDQTHLVLVSGKLVLQKIRRRRRKFSDGVAATET